MGMGFEINRLGSMSLTFSDTSLGLIWLVLHEFHDDSAGVSRG